MSRRSVKVFLVLCGAAWAVFVCVAHAQLFPPPFAMALQGAERMVAAARHLSLSLVLDYLAVIACAACVVLAATVAGGWLITSLRIDSPFGIERRVLSMAAGFGILSYASFVLTAVGWMTTGVAWLVVGSLCLLGLPRLRRAMTSGLLVSLRHGSWLDRAAAVAVVLQAALTLFWAMAPLIFYDSLAYHFSAAHLSILSGHFVPMRENLLAQMPAAGGSLYAIAWMLKDEIVAKVICWCSGVAVLAILGAHARRFSLGRGGLWASLIFFSIYHVGQAATGGGVDLLLTLFSACAVHTFLVWVEGEFPRTPREASEPPPSPAVTRRPRAWLLLSGVFAGLAMATKYSGVLIAAALIAFLVVAQGARTATRGRALRGALSFVLIAAVVLSPWLVRNAMAYGNPVAPFLSRVFTPTDEAEIRAADVFAVEAAKGPLRTLPELLALPWTLTMGVIPDSAVFTPLFLALGPLLIVGRGLRPRLRRTAWVTGFFGLGWLLTTTSTRYLLPCLPWTCLILGCWVAHALPSRPLRVAVKGLVLTSCLTAVLISHVVSFRQDGWRVLLGEQTKSAYLAQSHVGYTNPSNALYEWIDAELPPTTRVLLVGETRAYYLEREFLCVSVFREHPLIRWAEDGGPEGLESGLADAGITHILVNSAEARRLRPYGSLRISPGGADALERFWLRSVRPVVTLDETTEGQITNRLALYEVSPAGRGGSPLPPLIRYILDVQ